VLLHTVALIRVRRYLLMYFTLETLLNHVFEVLRKPKAPNKYLLMIVALSSVQLTLHDTQPIFGVHGISRVGKDRGMAPNEFCPLVSGHLRHLDLH
jgi:hypothetical protein